MTAEPGRLNGPKVVLFFVRAAALPCLRPFILAGILARFPPCILHVDGDMVPAVFLPPELEDAMARAVLEGAEAILMVASLSSAAIRSSQ